MVFNQSPKNDIKMAADIVDLIGQFVQLKKAGRNYVGLCPFHGEKDPSFSVNQERQTFHCFGCKRGGDIFSFWMEYHKISFMEAMNDLADRYNIQIPSSFNPEIARKARDRRKSLYMLNQHAMEYFQGVLQDSVKGKIARNYLEKRLVSGDIIDRFCLGYASDQWEGLTQFLRRRGEDLEAASEAGLIVPKKNRSFYDRFRERLIFPIFDYRTQVIGFGGRVLDNAKPKYINTPESSIFHKGESLYGLQTSIEAIRAKGMAIIVEGYMDCLALKKNGLEEVVATLGTALTTNHIRRLKGYAKEAVVIFDSDQAGQAAVVRSLPLFSNEALEARIVVLPEGHDPDSFINTYGMGQFSNLLQTAVPILDFFLELKLKEQETDEGRVFVMNEILRVFSEIRNEPLLSLYVRRLADKIGIRENIVQSELSKITSKRSFKPLYADMTKSPVPVKAETNVSDLQLLSLLVNYTSAVPQLVDIDCQSLLTSTVSIEIINSIFEIYLKSGDVASSELEDVLKTEAAREQLREIQHRPFVVYSQEDVEQAIVECKEKINHKKLLASLKKAKGDIQAQNWLVKGYKKKDCEI